MRRRYGVAGARGEAVSNFPHVLEFGLPMLRKQRASGCSEEVSRLDALLNVMTDLDDTCVLYRGGVRALAMVKSGAKAVLSAGGCGHANGRKQLQRLDRALIAGHISPGGSADLLAATIFLDGLERRQRDVREDWSEQEAENGAAYVRLSIGEASRYQESARWHRWLRRYGGFDAAFGKWCGARLSSDQR